MKEFDIKTRLINALTGKPVDKVPVVSVTQTAITELMELTGAAWPEAHSDAEKMATLAVASHKLGGLEAVRYPFCLTVLAEALGCKVNIGTNNRQPSIIEHIYELGLDDLHIPANLDEIGRIPTILKTAKIVREMVSEEIPIIAGMEGPVTLASHLVSLKKFMKWSIKKPDDFEAILNFATDVCIKYANLLIDSEVDIICVADGVASPDLMSPAVFDTMFKTRFIHYADSVDCIKILHICGNTKPILDMMADCKFEGISIEEKVHVKDAKEIINKRAALVGNISSPFTILSGTKNDVKESVRKALDDGIDVIAPGCGIAPNSPLVNVKALVEGRDEYYL